MEGLQLSVRELSRTYDNRLASDFCKRVLMTPQLKQQIEKLVLGG